jgi:hypothetical protein
MKTILERPALTPQLPVSATLEQKVIRSSLMATKEDRADQPKLSKSQWIAQSVKMLAGSDQRPL